MLDAQLRLAALQEARASAGAMTPMQEIISRAQAFYTFLAAGVPEVAPIPTLEKIPVTEWDERPGAEAVEKAKRTRRTKAEMEAARAADADKAAAEIDPVAAVAETTAAAPAPAVEPAGAPPDMAAVKAALMGVVQAEGKGVARGGELLKQFGVARVSELKDAQYPDFIAACLGAR